MRTIQTTAGTDIELDGDVLAILEAISRDLARQKTLEYGFEDVEREFQHLTAQMTDAELRTYFKEAMVMSFNRYENERLAAMIRKARQAKTRGARTSGSE
jgi:hypothetical protein